MAYSKLKHGQPITLGPESTYQPPTLRLYWNVTATEPGVVWMVSVALNVYGGGAVP